MRRLREQRLELAGTETRSLELDGEGPPLVLLHGWADSADTWRRLLGVAAARGRAAVAYDLPGFGTAAPLDATRPVMPQLERFAAAAVRRTAEASGSEVILAGNSLGGATAMRAAERRELPLAGTVPIAPAGLDMAQWFTLIEGARLITALMRSPLPLPEIVVRESVGRAYRAMAFCNPAAADAAAVASFTRHFGDRASVARVLATGRRLRGELRRRDVFRLDRIGCPLLIVWGEQDRMVFPTGAERVLRAVPGSRLQRIPGCGHCPQVECPERLWELIGEFPAAAGAAALH